MNQTEYKTIKFIYDVAFDEQNIFYAQYDTAAAAMFSVCLPGIRMLFFNLSP